jgi:hypothetical protein
LVHLSRRNAWPARLRHKCPYKPQGGAAHCRGGRARCSMTGAAVQKSCCPSETGGEIRFGTDGRVPAIRYCSEISFVAGRAVSFQITILKVLAGHPDGRASVAELTRYVSILMSSGSDWTDRMRRLAARAHQISKFLPMHLCCGTIAVGASRIPAGSSWLRWKRRSPSTAEEPQQPPGPRAAAVTASPIQPTLRLVVDNTRTSQPGIGPDETRRSA